MLLHEVLGNSYMQAAWIGPGLLCQHNVEHNLVFESIKHNASIIGKI